MGPRPVHFLVAFFALAGCASPPDAEAVPLAEVTDPGDYSYLQEGTPGNHVHNYWGGQDRLTLLDLDAAAKSGQTRQVAIIAGDFRPVEGSIVPQGTGLVEATAAWTLDDGNPTRLSHFQRMELWVKTAADQEHSIVIPVEQGQPVRFNVSNEQDDPPHYQLSLWRFWLMAINEEGGDTIFAGQASLKVDIHRTNPLPVFPPHPDLWAGRDEIVVTEGFRQTVDYHAHIDTVTDSCNGCLEVIPLDDNQTVPPDAGEVVVELTMSTPVGLELYYHAADSYEWILLDNPGEALGNTRTYRIPVDGRGDSPYATQSLWEFSPWFETPVGLWTGQLEARITVHR